MDLILIMVLIAIIATLLGEERVSKYMLLIWQVSCFCGCGTRKCNQL